MTVQETSALHKRMNRLSELMGTLLVDGFHYLALFAIGAAVVWSAVHAFIGMAAKGSAGIDDILLLFIYSSSAQWSGSTSRPTTCRFASSSMWR